MSVAWCVSIAILGATACDGQESPAAWSLDGKPLFPPKFQGYEADALKAQVAIAQDDLIEDAERSCGTDPAKQVWFGRRLAYQWRYLEAIDVFSTALGSAPQYAMLYRHRGHRYLTIRNFSKAIVDLSKAAELVQGKQDGWEADGAPGPYNLPLSSKHFNVFYHLGLACYFMGDYNSALDAYVKLERSVMAEALNDESIEAVAHWRYMSLRRLGRDEDAEQALANIHAGMRTLDGGAYLNLTLLYRGERGEAEVLGPEPTDLDLATVGYGIGNWHWYSGRIAQAKDMWRRVVATSYWASFGYIAAEAELYRLEAEPNLEAKRNATLSLRRGETLFM